VDPEEALLIALTAKSFHVHIFNGDDKLHTQLDWFPVATIAASNRQRDCNQDAAMAYVVN
jgi:hypothetical protein